MPKNVITSVNCSFVVNTVNLVIKLNFPRDVRLIWSTVHPIKRPLFRTNRGIRRQCGFDWWFAEFTCETDLFPGVKRLHVWQFDVQPIVNTVYMAVVEDCNPTFNEWTSVLITCERGEVTEIPVAARVYRSTSQGIPNNALTAVSFDVEVFDHEDLWDAANPTRLTAPITGIYAFGMTVEWDALAADILELVLLRKNGSVHLAENVRQTTGNSVATPNYSVHTIDELQEGDYIEALVAHADAGLNRNIRSDVNERPAFWMARIP